MKSVFLVGLALILPSVARADDIGLTDDEPVFVVQSSGWGISLDKGVYSLLVITKHGRIHHEYTLYSAEEDRVGLIERGKYMEPVDCESGALTLINRNGLTEILKTKSIGSVDPQVILRKVAILDSLPRPFPRESVDYNVLPEGTTCSFFVERISSKGDYRYEAVENQTYLHTAVSDIQVRAEVQRWLRDIEREQLIKALESG